MTDLRDKIARAIHDGPGAQAQYVKAGIAPHGFENCRYSEQYFNDADAVLAVLDLDKVRAEAQVEALREASADLAGAEPQHLGGADEGLEFFDYGTAAEYGIDVAAAYLRNVANETAREAGIETGGH